MKIQIKPKDWITFDERIKSTHPTEVDKKGDVIPYLVLHKGDADLTKVEFLRCYADGNYFVWADLGGGLALRCQTGDKYIPIEIVEAKDDI